MAKAAEQTNGDNPDAASLITDVVTAAPASAPAPRAPKAAPHPWDQHKTEINGLTIYNFTRKAE